jgi:hypothetical protein
MSEPSNGITPELIRSFVPPYRLSDDLLAATIACIPPPPPDAPQPWRHARITRLLEEIGAYHPADSAQARLVTQLVIVREAADTFSAGIYAPGLTPEQRCRLSRSAAEQRRGAEALERILARHQQLPTSFYGTVVPDGADIPALNAIWRTTPPPPAATDLAEPSAPRPAAHAPSHTAEPPIVEPPVVQPPIVEPRATLPAAPTPTPTPAPPPSETATPEWSRIKLDEGPGWSREVLRHRSATAAPPEPVA